MQHKGWATFSSSVVQKQVPFRVNLQAIIEVHLVVGVGTDCGFRSVVFVYAG